MIYNLWVGVYAKGVEPKAGWMTAWVPMDLLFCGPFLSNPRRPNCGIAACLVDF